MEYNFAVFCVIICISCLPIALPKSNDKPRHPVVLVPGDGGSQFEAKLDKKTVPHVWCTKVTNDWFPLWLNLELLVPYVLDCFTDNMKLVYDETTRTTHNSPGVFTRQVGFGNTSTVEWLDASHFSHTQYFSSIVDMLVNDLGYTRNVNIRGAPYDFRKAPNEMGQYIDDLRQLIEDSYTQNNGTRVVLLGHSMGCMYSLYTLYQQPQAWRDKYIHSMLTLAGPWGGALKTLRLMASGDDLGVFVLNPLAVRIEQRSMPSSAWLLPYDNFWNSSDVLVYGPTYNYTVKDYKRFFDDIHFPVGYLMREDTERLVYGIPAPGVTVHCLHGNGVQTPAALRYSHKQWYDSQPDVDFGDGDGTVNLHSLHGCLRWQGKQKQTVYHQEFTKADHMEILHDKAVLAYIKTILS